MTGRMRTENQAIIAAYASGGYTMKEIGDYFGLHQSRISKIIRAAPGRGMSQDLTLGSP